jgi:hypothetical protein
MVPPTRLPLYAPSQSPDDSLDQGRNVAYSALGRSLAVVRCPDAIGAPLPAIRRCSYERVQWPYIDPNGEVLLESLREQQEWFLQNKAISAKVDV